MEREPSDRQGSDAEIKLSKCVPQSSQQHFPLSCIYHGEDPAELAFNKRVVTGVMLCMCVGG